MKQPTVSGPQKKRAAKKDNRAPVRGRRRLGVGGIAAAAALALTLPAGAQFVIQPNEALSKDTAVYQFTGGIIPGTIYAINSAEGHSFKSLLQFDLTAIPISAGQITLATVELYAKSASGPGEVSAYQVNGSWTENGVTWATFPTLAPLAADTETVSTVGQWYSFDVTTLVQGWKSGSVANNGIALVMGTAEGNVSFYDASGLTGATPDPTLAPRLTVVPEPATGILGLCGMLVCAARRRSSNR